MPELTAAQQRRLADGRRRLAAAKVERVERQTHLVDTTAALRESELELTRLQAKGATARTVAAAERRREKLIAERAESERLTIEADRLIRDVTGNLDNIIEGLLDPYAALGADTPIALFPVRLETRFIGDELRVRIYPDVVHIDQLERQLTAEEEAYGHRYWRDRWVASTDDAPALWERYLTGGPTNRVAWIVTATRPVNIEHLGRGEPEFPKLTHRAPGPSQPPVARLLPQRWKLVGYRGGDRVLETTGSTIPDVLQAGIDPAAVDDDLGDADDPVDLPDEQDHIALDDGARWLVDYDAAVDVGMAVTVTEKSDSNLRRGYDRLIVIGVDHRAEPDEAATELRDTIEAHYFSDGTGFAPIGTATNASADDHVATTPRATDPSAPRVETSAGRAAQLAQAFGWDDADILHRFAHADGVHEPLARDLNIVLWEPTLGYFLRQILDPIVTDGDAARLRNHFRDFVRAGGPLPLLRVGRQPLGVLPVTLLNTFDGGRVEAGLADLLRGMWRFWTYSMPNARQIGDSGDPAADLVELLERLDRSAGFRVREVFGPVYRANTEGIDDLGAYQEIAAQFTLALLGVGGRPEIVDMTVDDGDWVAPFPLVTGTPGDQPLDPDYVARIAARLRSVGGRKLLREVDPGNATTLLEALLLHAAELEIERSSAAMLLAELALPIEVNRAVRDLELDVAPSTEVRSIDQIAIIDDGGSPRLNVAADVMPEMRITSVTGRVTLADFLTGGIDNELKRIPHTAQFLAFRGAVDRLRGVPSAELHDAVAGTLDLVSHRFDAWVTSLAASRLAEQRRGDGRSGGVHVGGFGWVDDLRPSGDSVSVGYVHAPSIQQATTAAILRSGHLSRTDGNDEPLAIDLSSRRTRDALVLIDAMRSGQSLAAVLGYRFERALRDQGVEFAAYIYPTRQLHPLDEGGDSGSGPTEAIAARNVVDGIALAELDDAGRASLMSTIGASAAHRSTIAGLLDGLVDAFDAVGDVLTAESVHQAVLGNVDRAAAALDALDRQELPPDISVTRTPRSGYGIGQRVMVHLDRDRPPSSWNRLRDLRGDAAPRVNAWVGHLLGDPDDFELAADVLDAAGVVIETVSVSLRSLGMSPLSIVLATTAGSDGSEFENRLGLEFAAAATAAGRASLRARIDAVSVGKRGLAELVALAHHIGELLSSARPAELRDLVATDTTVDENIDVDELSERVAAVRAATDAVADIDPDGLAAMSDRRLSGLIEQAADLGYPGMIPTSDDHDELVGIASRAVNEARARRERVDAVAPTASTRYARALAEQQRLTALLGDGFPAVARLIVPDDVAAVVDAALADDKLQGEALAATEWMRREALVRPSVERLWVALATGEAFGAEPDTTKLSIAQMPRVESEPWVNTPAAFEAGPPIATTSMVIHHLEPDPSLKGTVSMLVIDQWHEQVPSRSETTGVSFHFDGPGARPPQSMLLAVHPDPSAEHWSESTVIDIIDQTADLAVMRSLDLDDVSAAGRFLPATYLPFDLSAPFLILDWASIIKLASITWHTEDDA